LKALVVLGPGVLELKEVQRPYPNKGEVLVKVKACCVGAADVRIYRADPVQFGMISSYVPFILGAEGAGEVEEVGEEVSNLKPGDKVVAELTKSACEKCFFCRTGYHFLCSDARLMGRGSDGLFAEYFKTSAKFLHKIPTNVSFEEAAVTEDLAVVVNALTENTIIQPGDFVVILGPGPIGLLSVQVAKAIGAGMVMIAGLKNDKPRLEMAHKIGADMSINIDEEQIIERVKSLTRGRGADVVIEASGSPYAVEQAIELVRKQGKIIAIGITKDQNINVPWHKITLKSISIIGSLGHRWTSWEKALNFISMKKVNVLPLITHKFSLEDWKQAFESLERKEAIKPLIIP